MNDVDKTREQLISELVELRQHVHSAETTLQIKESLIEEMQAGVALIRIEDSIVMYTNSTFNEMFGYPANGVIGQHVSVLSGTPPQQTEKFIKCIIETMKTHVIWKGEIKNRRKDNTHFYSYANIVPLYHPKYGDVWMAVHTDMTSHRQAENELSKFSFAVEQSPNIVILTDTNGEIEYVNAKFTDVTGYSIEEVLGKNPRFLKSDDMEPEQYASLWQHILSGHEWRGEFRNKKKNGEFYFASSHIAPLKSHNGEVTHFIELQEDITERKRIIDTLKYNEHRYYQAQRAANMGSWDWDIVTGDLYWSDHIDALFGIAEGGFGGTYGDFLNCVHPEDRDFVTQSIRNCLETDSDYGIEHRIIWLDGTVRWVSETGDVLRDENGKAIRMMGIVQDITGRKQAEEALRNEEQRHFKEMNQIKDQLVQMVSHDLKNPISVIAIYADLLKKTLATTDTRINDFLEAIQGGVLTMKNLVNNLLDLNRIESGHALHLKEDSLGQLITNCIDDVMVLAKEKHINLHYDLSEADIIFSFDTDRMQQAITNLLSNAIKYTPEGGNVRIHTRLTGDEIQLTIEDTGLGISDEELPKLFDKFYRIPRAEFMNIAGSGLGLSIVKAIIDQHNGRIEIKSQLNQGSTFTVILPVA